jgi:dGTP triphosphohydrolase
MKRIFLVCAIFALCLTVVAYAKQPGGPVQDTLNKVEDDILSCEAKYDDSGVIKSMKCSGEAEMAFADAKGVRIAREKAIMRAKASMSKFMKESIHSKEIMDDMTKTLSNRTTGQTESAIRKAVETQTEQIVVESQALLKGVTVLYTDVNRDKKTVIVHLGVNRKTMRAADSAGRAKLDSDISGKAAL